ncbi:MAG: hypothetical protein M1816_007614 [Peltula sp. TS41687]|nr:MAG: hypothetical protein M1816_007614 [Peltula sp. TS41687]
MEAGDDASNPSPLQDAAADSEDESVSINQSVKAGRAGLPSNSNTQALGAKEQSLSTSQTPTSGDEESPLAAHEAVPADKPTVVNEANSDTQASGVTEHSPSACEKPTNDEEESPLAVPEEGHATKPIVADEDAIADPTGKVMSEYDSSFQGITLSDDEAPPRPPQDSNGADERSASNLVDDKENSSSPSRRKRKADSTDRTAIKVENDELDAETDLIPRPVKRIRARGVFSKRALYAYVAVPGTAKSRRLSIIGSVPCTRIRIADLCKVVSSEINENYYPTAIYGLKSARKWWGTLPETMIRLRHNHHVKAWLKLFYPNPKDTLYIYVVLDRKGKESEQGPDVELPSWTEEEYAALEGLHLSGTDGGSKVV